MLLVSAGKHAAACSGAGMRSSLSATVRATQALHSRWLLKTAPVGASASVSQQHELISLLQQPISSPLHRQSCNTPGNSSPGSNKRRSAMQAVRMSGGSVARTATGVLSTDSALVQQAAVGTGARTSTGALVRRSARKAPVLLQDVAQLFVGKRMQCGTALAAHGFRSNQRIADGLFNGLDGGEENGV